MKYIPIKQFFKTKAFIYYPLLLVFGGGLFLYYFPIPFFPDFFRIKEYSKIYELFNLIISSLVSLIGIYITVSLVAYEFFKQKSGIDFQKSFLINMPNAYYISFSVFTILFAFISSIIISNDNPNNQEITLIYYNAFLFVSVISCLFPIAFNLFSSLRPEKLADEELHKINANTIFIEAAEKGDIDMQTEYFENDSLLKIENIVIALIAVKDFFKVRAIIQKVTLKLSSLIIEKKNTKDKEYIIERLIDFYIRIIDFSLPQPNNSAILRSIWLSVEAMYSVLIDRKETAVHFKKFNEIFFERYFNRLLTNYNEEIVFEGIKTIRRIIQNQVLFNMADDMEIYSFNSLRDSFEKDFEYTENYSDENLKNTAHWDEVAVELTDCFSFLVSKGILLNQPDLINKCFEQLDELNFELYLKKIGIYKQSYFHITVANIICDYTYEAFKKNVFIEGHDAKYLTPSLLNSLIKEKHPVARNVLNKYCSLLIKLQHINKLDRWFLGGYTIGGFYTREGELGQILRHCLLDFMNNEEVLDCLEDCINTFEILKEYYEKNPPEDLELYTIIKWQLNNLLKLIERKDVNVNVNVEKVTEKFRILISSFKEENEFDTSQSNKQSVLKDQPS